uniref:FAM86 N-terminal domain-containing protein n=1 Tax=Phaeomonas parva TaxID=124430 RepID=A0A7S1TRJ2_9STRA|eukprot:CAMPEP_0118853480 /NCGR_PEP_ID=MMETSP1163-20130328/2045_1 /TAXON_ID=124430 /ORGANISM="Phaeomonas parva, Strain CCMP2877" /LENGTH=366 /DNA_ID=CAMNT_0006786037 /DNA_START=582 /DNA_END=1682 /DNA_ORIENTATION=+
MAAFDDGIAALVATADPSLSDLLDMRLAGGYSAVIARLSSASGADLEALLIFLGVALTKDGDAAHDFAGGGGHAALQRIMMRSGDEALAALACEVIAASSRHGVSFPSPAALGGAIRPAPTPYAFDGPAGALALRLRDVPKRQTAQKDTGFIMWPAAVVLARFLNLKPENVAGKAVLEIGAGLGLAGFAAVPHAAHVTLSDYNDEVLENLRYNAALNFEARAQAPGLKFPAVRFLDFHEFRPIPDPDAVAKREPPADAIVPGGDAFDVVLGTDMICCDEDAWSAAAVIAQTLKVGGVAYLCLADPRNRYGVESFPAALAAQPELTFEVKRVEDPQVMQDVTEQARYLDWNLFTVTRHDAAAAAPPA